MGLHELRSPRGSRRERRRRGQGDSAGQGSYSGRGFKGQKKRESVRPHFEGGQLKLIKRLPYMRGFHNEFRVEYVGVNLERLAAFGEGAEVSPDSLIQRGLVNRPGSLVKILGDGDAPAGIKVAAHAFSASAKTKIEAAGGTATVLAGPATAEPPAKSKGHLDERAKKAGKPAAADAPPKPVAEAAAGAPEKPADSAGAPGAGKGRKARQ
jgi:large subunit ribosomal protein L15